MYTNFSSPHSRNRSPLPACLTHRPEAHLSETKRHTIGVLRGEGIGPEVVDAALTVLRAVEPLINVTFDVKVGGPIGREAMESAGAALSSEVTTFCQEIFAVDGAILAGAGGGRFVYDMRQEFDLFCKISPIVTWPELQSAGRLKPPFTANVDICLVRDNSAGVYQGTWSAGEDSLQGRTASQSFSYDEAQVTRILRIAAAIAQSRNKELTVVTKPGGVPTISELWSACAQTIGRESGISIQELEIDNAAFQLVHAPQQFDVMVSPNLFGDILSDVAGVVLGSRGLCYGASYSPTGAAVYQTNHGAAHDLTGTNTANPVGQICSLAMMLRESFGLCSAANLIDAAVVDTWRQGYRTKDLEEDGCQVLSSQAMSQQIANAVTRLVESGATL